MSTCERDLIDLDLIKRQFDEYDKSAQLLPQTFIDLMVVNNGNQMEMLSLTDHKRIAHFGINSDGNYDPNQNIPKLIKYFDSGIKLDEKYSELFEANKLFSNYHTYRNNKWNYFLRCLRDNDIVSGEQPCFACFGGVIADLMASIENMYAVKDFRFCAQMFNGVIYLFINKREFIGTNQESFCGLKFLYLMSDRDLKNINEYEKHFSISSFKLGEHCILTLNEIDAIDQFDKPVELKSKKIVDNRKFIGKTKLLYTWCQCSVSGVNTILFGYRDNNNILVDVEIYETNGIPNRCVDTWSDVKCINFLNRVLYFIKQCVTEQFVVYEFCYCKREQFVSCKSQTGSNSLLPNWYIKSQPFEV